MPANTDVNWDRAYELARDRRDAERERLERIESKIAPIIAGAIAALGLFIDKASGWEDVVVAALLLIPIAMLLRTFRTTDYKDFPNLDELVQTFSWYPKTYVRSTVLGAAESVANNAVIIDRKARGLNRAMTVLYLTIIVVLGWRAGEAYYHEQHIGQQPAATTSTAIPTAASSHAPKHAGLHQEKR